jgi:hypothetical protein
MKRKIAEIKYIIEHTDDEPDEAEVEDWFRTVYGREPDDEDREVGLFSLVCAGILET